jgi:small subunit ribosomal protein S21
VKIEVFDNQIEAALKTLKKQLLKDGIFQEMKRRAHYEKPSVKRKRKQAMARKRRPRARQSTPWGLTPGGRRPGRPPFALCAGSHPASTSTTPSGRRALTPPRSRAGVGSRHAGA